MFKRASAPQGWSADRAELLQADAIDVCQIDSCRLGGVNECLSVLLMSAIKGVPVCPHAGGVGLCVFLLAYRG